jgi:DNA (cytosine-5)-methyltransferase 1
MDDARNHLFKDYCALVEAVAPDAFLFENVPGLLNMEGGAVFSQVKDELRKVAKEVRVWRVSAEEYGVPQRRKRVVVAGFRTWAAINFATGPLSSGFFGGVPVSVEDALGDLPPLVAGQDGSALDYRTIARTPYQRLMRAEIGAEEYIATLGGLSQSWAMNATATAR